MTWIYVNTMKDQNVNFGAIAINHYKSVKLQQLAVLRNLGCVYQCFGENS